MPQPHIEVVGYPNHDAADITVLVVGWPAAAGAITVDPGSSACSPAEWRELRDNALTGASPAAAERNRQLHESGADTQFATNREVAR